MSEPRVIRPISHRLRSLGVALCCMCMPPALFAAAGDLDCRFGLGGTVVQDFGLNDAVYDAQLTSDGRIVTIGSISGVIRLSRFLPNGQLDATFGSNGSVVHNLDGLEFAQSLAIDSLDRIVVSGRVSLAGDEEVFAARFTSDGAFDTAFGDGDGWTSFDFTAGTANAGSEGNRLLVVVDANDRPMIGGSPDANGPIFNPSDRNMAVARLTASGALDSTFDGDGIAIASTSGMVDDTLYGLEIDPLGRVVAIGLTKTFNRDTLLARWTVDGALDSSFDGDGVLIVDTSESDNDDIGKDIGFSSTGHIVGLSVAVKPSFSPRPRPAVFRLTETGALDTTFAVDGITQRSFFDGQDVVQHVRVQADDKILVTGWPVTGFAFHFAVMRFTADGLPDVTWSAPGGVTSTVIGSNSRTYAAILQPDQKLILLGGLDNNRDFVMARYLNDGDPNGPSSTTQITSHLPDPSLVGRPVIATYAVTSASGTPTGTVTVSDGQRSCSASVDAGSCTLTLFAAGVRPLTASYAGDGTYCPSADSQPHSVVVPTRSLFTQLQPSASVVGQPVQVGVTVTPLNVGGVGPVTGSVSIDDGAGASCVGALDNGSMACSLVPTIAGVRTWTATYASAGIFVTSQVQTTRTVAPALTTTTITADTPDPSLAGIPVQVSVDVTAQAPGSGIPTGMVNIDDGSGANCQLVLSAGTGSCQLIPIIPGVRDLTANYLGDTNYALSFATEAHLTTGQDFGDAPSPYPVVLADDGPRHGFGDLFLGASIDAEPNGQPSASASGDDLAGIDDEDGIIFASTLLPGGTVEMIVTASRNGTLDAWIDFAADGNWDQPNDHIIDNLAVISGTNSVNVAIPGDAVAGNTIARFRLSSTGVSAPTGAAADGEVEDYQITINLAAMELSYTATPAQIPETGGTIEFSVQVDNNGDLPFELTTLNSATFGGLNGLGNCGLPQTVSASGSYTCSFQQTLSGAPGAQTDALSASATVQSLTISDSAEANYAFGDELPQLSLSASADPTSVREPGANVSFIVMLNNPGLEAVTVSTLMDDQIGALAGVGDCVLPQLLAAAGTYQCTYSAQVVGTDGDTVTHTVSASGTDDESNNVDASDNAQILITPGLDYGDAPSPYPVLLVDDGPRHGASDLFLGAVVDVESDGQPSPNASGDDLAGTDDEDGVSFASLLVAGEMAELTVLASQPGTLDAWIDYAGDGSWTQPTDRIINSLAVVSGPNAVSISVPSDAVAGATVARFRLSSAGAAAPTGPAADGEVEDYETTINTVGIELSYTATPAQIPETGGTIEFSVEIDNGGDLPLELTTLTSTAFGSLAGLGNCTLPQTVSTTVRYVCTFQQTLSGTSGPQTDALFASATVQSLTVSDTDEANYSFDDELPQLSLSVSADPTSVSEPGENVSFTVILSNPGLEAVTVSVLVDDQIGSLSDVGDCVLPQLLPADAVYQCTYSADVLGADGDTVTHTVNASAADDESNSVDASDTAQVVITDGLGPRVTQLSSLGGTIEHCATVRTVANGLAVRFSEPVLQAELLSSYLIVHAGVDADFSTNSCSGAVGDDLIQVIIGAVSDGDPATPTINLQLDQRLPIGLARVFVCPAITDLAGNALDGNGDGSAGDAYINTFRFDAYNLLSNGDFDRCPVTLAPWQPITTLPNTIDPNEVVDADGSTLSGSAQISSSADQINALAQCVAVPKGQSRLALSLKARLDAAGTATAEILLGCDYFDLADCAGPSSGGQMDARALPDLSGDWSHYVLALQPPTTAISALCSAVVTADTPGQSAFDAYVDSLYLSVDSLFANGFETVGANRQSGSAD